MPTKITVIYDNPEDPDAFDQLKKDAPAEWSFASIKELDAEPADWWKSEGAE